MKANPNSKVMKTGVTRDGVTAFLHEDGTISNRVTTFGFGRVPTSLMDAFFEHIGTIHSGDVAKAIKESKKGKLPTSPDPSQMVANANRRLEKARIEIMYNRSIKPWSKQ